MYISEVLDTSLEERYAFFSDFLFDLYINALTFDYVACLYWVALLKREGQTAQIWNFAYSLNESFQAIIVNIKNFPWLDSIMATT